MAGSENTVKKIYQTVIDEVIQNVREQFLDEGYDDQFLQELKHMWETKLNSCRAVSDEKYGCTLPIQPAKDNHKNSSNNNNNNSDRNDTSTAKTTTTSTTSTTTTNTSSNSSIESSTMAAINALPQSHQPPTAQFINDIKPTNIIAKQLDGIDDSSDDEDEDEDDLAHISSQSNDDYEDDDVKNDDYEGKEDSDPLNSGDDVSEIDSNELFDTDNVIICQYDKITRIKNRWKFHLKDGVMNINGKDYLFSKANGDAEW